MRTDCIILGGGAAGLTAAAALSRAGIHSVILERGDRVGRKLLATGNGRCNLSNLDLSPAHYGDAAPFVDALCKVTPPQEVLDFFTSLGLMTAVEDGRIYPRTMQAASVLDVLRMGAMHAEIMTGCEVKSVTPSRRGGWSVLAKNGEGFVAPVVFAAMGGSASPQFGTDGSGVRLLEALGHSAKPAQPALVQLRCAHPALKSLKGIRANVSLTLIADHTPVASETGEILFADYGVSGVCVFQLSRFVPQLLEEGRQVALLVDLLPELSAEARDAWLTDRLSTMPDCPAKALLTGVLPRMLAQAVLKQADILPDKWAKCLDAGERASLLDALTAFILPITGTQGLENAQVTCGGILLSEVDPETMHSRLFDGLYLAGEMLDADGPCGGYNLHFAFAGALTAAKAIARQLK